MFVATVTGNLVFLGLAAAGAKGFNVGTSALAVGGFIVGALIGARACQAARSHRGLALRNVLGVKASLAGVVTAAAFIFSSPFSTGVRDTILVLLAISMGAQLAAIRYLKVPDLMTVVLTMTITSALTERGRGWNDAVLIRRGLSLVAFAVGALSGHCSSSTWAWRRRCHLASRSSSVRRSLPIWCRAAPRAGRRPDN